MANPSVTYTFTNGTVADATQMNQNWTDIINSLTDGSKSLNIDAITAAGTATLNGAVDLGNATGDVITVNGAFAGTGGDASETQKGLVTTGAQTIAGVKTFNSGVVLGAGNTALKCKVLTGITAAAENGEATVAHGLTGNDILGWTTKIIYSTNKGLSSNWNDTVEFEYNAYHDETNFVIVNSATNSGNILSKTFYIMVWYV